MSDHFSGPRAFAQPIADITDLYAFPSPERPGYLVLVQRSSPRGSRTGSSTVSACAQSPRVGRPEVRNFMLGPAQFDRVNRDLETRDLYNMDDAFQLARTYRAAYRARLNANLGLDGNDDWPADEDGAHPLTELVLADFLIADVTKPYAEQGSFLEIELAARGGRVHETCGGRALNDDVMDTVFTLLINAGNGPRIRDGVDQATMPASRTFPYLAPPNPNPPEPPETEPAIRSEDE